MSCGNKGVPLVIFADDDPDILEMLAFAAKTREWEVVTCKTGRELLAKVNTLCCQGCCPDMIVADVHYFDHTPGPKMTGISAGREIRKKFPDIPMLFLTAYVTTLLRHKAHALNAEMESKPITDLSGFLDRIELMMQLSGGTYYNGPERRMQSINYTKHQRRRTDIQLKVPDVIAAAMSAARKQG
jgi:CheY-like chemotaxis protein